MQSATRNVIRAGARAFHSSPVARGGGHGGQYEYLHAKYMYTLRDKPMSKPKAFMMVFGLVATGVSIPIIAVEYNHRKAGLK